MTDEQSGDKKPNYDPWTGKGKQNPPDLDELLKKLYQNMKGKKLGPFQPMTKHPLAKIKGALITTVLVLVWLIAGFFLVQPAERAVVLRFGEYITTLGPGPHWIPPLIERRYIVNEEKVDTYSYQANMLTRDENIVSVAVSVLYRIGSARDYLFNVVSPQESLQQATASALRQVIGHSTLDAILTYGRSEIRAQVEAQLKEILARYNTGIIISDVVMQPARAPEEVKEAFDDAIKAQEDEQRLINQAQAYAMKIIPLAEGTAKRMLADANAYKEKVVLQAKGEGQRFLALMQEYHKAPKVTRERLYLQAMEKLYSNTQKVIVDIKQSNPFIYLPLDKMMANSSAVVANPETPSEGSTHVTTPAPVTTENTSVSAVNPLAQERDRPTQREGRLS